MACTKQFSIVVLSPSPPDCQTAADAWIATLQLDPGFHLTIHPTVAYTGPPFTLNIPDLTDPGFSTTREVPTGQIDDIVVEFWFGDQVGTLTATCGEIPCEDALWQFFYNLDADGSTAEAQASGINCTFQMHVPIPPHVFPGHAEIGASNALICCAEGSTVEIALAYVGTFGGSYSIQFGVSVGGVSNSASNPTQSVSVSKVIAGTSTQVAWNIVGGASSNATPGHVDITGTAIITITPP